MEYIIENDDKRYLLVINDISKAEKNADALRLYYSDLENDWIDYMIEVFIQVEDSFNPIKIKELPDSLRDIIAKEIEHDLKRTFIANPYFDEVLIFFGSEVFTYQEKLKQIQCNQCERKNLYEMRGNINKTTYINNIQKLIEEDKNPDWPFKEKLLVQFTISDVQSKLDKIDVDNLAKTMFDTFKELIYEDDSQIVSFAGDKSSVNNIKAFIIAIKRLELNERPFFQDYIFSGKMNAWKEEHEKKKVQNKKTRFKYYGESIANSF
jgi:Holliday junction resolvase RusA-like endonuclease